MIPDFTESAHLVASQNLLRVLNDHPGFWYGYVKDNVALDVWLIKARKSKMRLVYKSLSADDLTLFKIQDARLTLSGKSKKETRPLPSVL